MQLACWEPVALNTPALLKLYSHAGCAPPSLIRHSEQVLAVNIAHGPDEETQGTAFR